MKPPYYSLTATCPTHGQVTVQRKPNPKAGQRHPNGCGGVIDPHPAGVVCPHCPFLAKVIKAELIAA